MSVPGSSTQPFGSSTEEHVEERLRGLGEPKEAVGAQRQQKEVAKGCTTLACHDVGQLVEAFNDVSITSLPETRIVLTHPP